VVEEMKPVLDVERDLVFVEEMATDLEPYLLSKTLYWSLNVRLSARHQLLKGTLGGMLFRVHRLSASSNTMMPDQQQRLHDARSRIEAQLAHWAVQVAQKAAREIKARLNSWGAYLHECQNNVRQYESEYPQQAEGRTILEFLFAYVEDDEAAVAARVRLIKLDGLLLAIAEPHEFVWDEALATTFPQDRFWWLYVWPASE
jgi:hypothetical protein